MKLSVVIPCYNEPDTLEEIVGRVFHAQLPEGWQREVVVVDDGSEEPTKRALLYAKRTHPELVVITRVENGGKGAALKAGFAAASGDYLVVQDADLEYDPGDFAALLAPIVEGRAEVVFGSRQLAHNNVPGRFFYYWGGRAVNALFNLAFGTRLSDLTTCYKVFPRALVPELIAQPANGFVFDAIELSRVLARRRILEVPISYRARDAEHGKKLKARDGLAMALRIVELALGRYAEILRFFIVGGSALLVNLAVLYLLTEGLGVWYLASEIVAFTLAVAYGYFLQKFWTFRDASARHAPQAVAFFATNAVNLVLNAALLYAFVEYLGLWYIGAQVVAAALIACESYFVYKVIFRAR